MEVWKKEFLLVTEGSEGVTEGYKFEVYIVTHL